jgi:endonuclease YncB( thermonuclease family)
MVRGASDIVAFAGAAWLGSLCLAAQACDLPPPETGTVAAARDGETLQLSDGRIVRLIGAKAPMPPLGWRGDDPWPLVEEAKAALSLLAAGKAVELRFGGARTDRHGYALAQVFVVEGERRLWLQQQLVAQGLARVYSFPDNRACVGELLAQEREARAKRLGVWASYAYRIEQALDVKRLGRLIHSYQLVGHRRRGRRGRRAPLSQFRAGLAERLHHQRRAQGCKCLRRCRHRPQKARRHAVARARLPGLAQRTHDRSEPS